MSTNHSFQIFGCERQRCWSGDRRLACGKWGQVEGLLGQVSFECFRAKGTYVSGK